MDYEGIWAAMGNVVRDYDKAMLFMQHECTRVFPLALNYRICYIIT